MIFITRHGPVELVFVGREPNGRGVFSFEPTDWEVEPESVEPKEGDLCITDVVQARAYVQEQHATHTTITISFIDDFDKSVPEMRCLVDAIGFEGLPKLNYSINWHIYKGPCSQGRCWEEKPAACRGPPRGPLGDYDNEKNDCGIMATCRA